MRLSVSAGDDDDDVFCLTMTVDGGGDMDGWRWRMMVTMDGDGDDDGDNCSTRCRGCSGALCSRAGAGPNGGRAPVARAPGGPRPSRTRRQAGAGAKDFFDSGFSQRGFHLMEGSRFHPPLEGVLATHHDEIIQG